MQGLLGVITTCYDESCIRDDSFCLDNLGSVCTEPVHRKKAFSPLLIFF